jgi:hypothetical protein
MNRKKLAKAVCIPVAVALGTSLAAEAADNPHVEPKQHEAEPRLTYDTPYTTTSMVMLSFPVWDDFTLKSVPVSILPQVKKK